MAPAAALVGDPASVPPSLPATLTCSAAIARLGMNRTSARVVAASRGSLRFVDGCSKSPTRGGLEWGQDQEVAPSGTSVAPIWCLDDVTEGRRDSADRATVE